MSVHSILYIVSVQWTLIYPDFTYPAARIIQTPNFPGIAICMLVFWPWWYIIIGAHACQQKMATPIVKHKRAVLFLLTLPHIANM